MVDKDLEERTISVVQGDNVHKEKDTTYTLQVQNVILQPITTFVPPHVSTPPSSQVIPQAQPPTLNDNNIFASLLNGPIEKLSYAPTTTILISTTTIYASFVSVLIPTTSIPLPNNTSEPLFTTQPISTPIFTYSTITTLEPINTTTSPKIIVQDPPSSEQIPTITSPIHESPIAISSYCFSFQLRT